MRIFKYLLVAVIVMFGVTGAANAQPCEADVPFQLTVGGEPYCIQVCNPTFTSFFIVGSQPGPEAFPVLSMASGCNPLETDCNVDCTPLEVPTGDWVFGGDPFNFYPDWWWLGNDCINFYIRWSHDLPPTWDIVIYATCEGCFCLSADDQLAVELQSFTAVAGDGEVSLDWTTASEASNDHFEIMRDGVAQAEIAGAGDASGAAYNWVDFDVQNGVTYDYTLVSVDVSGNREELRTVSATPHSAAAVTEYALHQNYPNPFNPETSIAFDLVESQFVTLNVTNLLGQVVATVASGQYNAGSHVVSFDGSELASGVYLYTITAGDFSAAKKLVLLK